MKLSLEQMIENLKSVYDNDEDTISFTQQTELLKEVRDSIIQMIDSGYYI